TRESLLERLGVDDAGLQEDLPEGACESCGRWHCHGLRMIGPAAGGRQAIYSTVLVKIPYICTHTCGLSGTAALRLGKTSRGLSLKENTPRSCLRGVR